MPASPSITREDVIAILSNLMVPHTQQDVVASGILNGVVVRSSADGKSKIGFALEVPAQDAHHYEPLRQQCEAALKRQFPDAQITAVLTASHTAGDISGKAPLKPAEWNSNAIPHVRHIIAIASGKGGVGKSTIAANLAAALSAIGLRVGLLDADIYGPSIPMMFGMEGKPEVKDNLLIPCKVGNIALMSMGMLVDASQAVVWRGSMATKALRQMLGGVAWGSAEQQLDILLVDTPPGTGDIHLTLAQAVPLSGVVLVSSPQDVAVLDAVKALAMFRKMAVPILGMVENMAGFIDPATGTKHDIFGTGGARDAAIANNIPLLAEIALDPALRIAGDAGRPLTMTDANHPAAKPFYAIATALLQPLGFAQHAA